jgi:hypothetical protein
MLTPHRYERQKNGYHYIDPELPSHDKVGILSAALLHLD